MRYEETNFFGDGLKFWIGKVVSKKAQKSQLDGKGWGWRYKVRIFGTYSENDNVPEDQVHNATVLFGVTVDQDLRVDSNHVRLHNTILCLDFLWLKMNVIRLLLGYFHLQRHIINLLRKK